MRRGIKNKISKGQRNSRPSGVASFSSKPETSDVPIGFDLKHTLSGHTDTINATAWSPDGNRLVSCSSDKSLVIWNTLTGKYEQKNTGTKSRFLCVAWSPSGNTIISGSTDNTIRLWDAKNLTLQKILSDHSGAVRSVAWSPNGRYFATGSDDTTLCIWNANNLELVQILTEHTGSVRSVAWSPDSWYVASGSDDNSIRIWNITTGKRRHTLSGHIDHISCVIWSPDGLIVASASYDNTIRLWDSRTGRQIRVLEGHTNIVRGICFTSDGKLLLSKSADNTVCVWRCDTWEAIGSFAEPTSGSQLGLSVHPTDFRVATLNSKEDRSDRSVRLWNVDVEKVFANAPESNSVHYTNAKVVLVGDAGVGKSGLGLVLTGQAFQATDSTHGRQVWTLENEEVELEGYVETREILLWDLAGQPGYRLVHQLHLNEVAVALVVFDGKSETDPFGGVRHWDRALKQAHLVQNNSGLPLKKFLVAARNDRGGVGVSQERIMSLVKEMGFDGYFVTSARENYNTKELGNQLRSSIDWQMMPKVTSTQLFYNIKSFIINEKKSGRILITKDELYGTYIKSSTVYGEVGKNASQFETCIGLVEAQGFVRRLGFGGLILLQPEILDAYASALVNAAKDEPDGMGCIASDDALAIRFNMPADERIRDRDREKLLLIATIEGMVDHEIVLKENAEDGPQLVFPAQFTRENPDLPDPEGKSIVFTFEGPVLNIYATLAVRISHSGVFKKGEMWKNASTFKTNVSGICGMFLREVEEGRGELTTFFSAETTEETRFQFEEYIYTHLNRRALPESIGRRRIFTCSKCGFIVSDQLYKLRAERSFYWVDCPACSDERISLQDREKRVLQRSTQVVLTMDRAADAQRDRDATALNLEGKIAMSDFDVFLCHNSVDKPAVKAIGQKLKEHGLLPWLDEWELRPGQLWQRALEDQIAKVKSVAVFVGPSGLGPWQDMEQEAFLRQFVHRGCPVIPVILPGCSQKPKLPIFLSGFTWVDYCQLDPDPLKHLIFGITGSRQ